MNEENEIFIHKNSMPKDVEENLSNLGLEDNNINGRIAHLRDTFLAAEREYVMEILKDKEVRQLIIDKNLFDGTTLYQNAQNIIDQVENNLIPYEKMETYEMVLIVLLAAIQDKVLRKELTFDDMSYGRSR